MSNKGIARPGPVRGRVFELVFISLRLRAKGAAPAVHEFCRWRCDISYHPRVREWRRLQPKNRYRHLDPRCDLPATKTPYRKEVRKCARRESSILCPFHPRFKPNALAVAARFDRPPASPPIPTNEISARKARRFQKKMEKSSAGRQSDWIWYAVWTDGGRIHAAASAQSR